MLRCRVARPIRVAGPKRGEVAECPASTRWPWPRLRGGDVSGAMRALHGVDDLAAPADLADIVGKPPRH